MKELKPVLGWVLKEKRDVTLAIFLGFLSGLASVALLASSGYLISRAALTSNLTILIILGACLKLFSLTAALSRYGERLFSHRATFSMLSSLRLSFFDKIVPQAPGIFQKYRSGDLLARIVGDVESLQNFLLRVFYPPVVLASVFLATIFFTWFYSVEIAIILFIGMIVMIFLIPAVFAWRMRRVDVDVRSSRSDVSIEATEFLYGFRELKIHQALDGRTEHLEQLVRDYGEQQRKAGLERNFNQSVSGLAGLLTALAVLAAGASLASTGELDAIFLAMLAMIAIGLFENVPQLAALPSFLEENRQAAVRLDAIGEEAQAPVATVELKQPVRFLEFDGVSYRYPGEQRDAVKDLSFSLQAGQKTAIVGPSGSGKSTVMALLLKAIAPAGGRIAADGTDLGQIEEESWWRQIAPVLQENHYFYGTLRSNLAIAREDATEGEMQDALEKVQLGHFSLDKQVEEKGGNLSGGEMQRLAIARAVLKDSPVALDEPVSSVDSVTAKGIYRTLFNEHAGDTFVIISHDLSGLEEMDRILVMDGGEIIEAGSYGELMAARGYFYELKQIEQTVFSAG